MANPFINYSRTRNGLENETFDISRQRPDVAIAKQIANLNSYASKEIVIEEEGQVASAILTQNPDTLYNKRLKEVGEEATFYEYYVITARSAVGFSGGQAISLLQASSGKLCYDARENKSPIQEGSTVRVQYSTDSSKDGKIVSVLGNRPVVTDETDKSPKEYKKWARKAYNELICEKAAQIKATPDAINGRIPARADFKKAPLVSFYSSINCDQAGTNWNPSPDNAQEIKIGKYLTLADLTTSGDIAKTFGIKNAPDEAAIANLKKLVTDILDPLIEKYKDKYKTNRPGIPFIINSAFRNLTINAIQAGPNEISSKLASPEQALSLAERVLQTQASGEKLPGPHVLGLAADISFPVSGEALLDLFEEISKMKEIQFGQMILESTGPGSQWFHMGAGSKRFVQMWGPWTDFKSPYPFFNRSKIVWDSTKNGPKIP